MLQGDKRYHPDIDTWDHAIGGEIINLRSGMKELQEENSELKTALNETREQVQALLDLCFAPNKDKFFDVRKEITLLRERLNALEKAP